MFFSVSEFAALHDRVIVSVQVFIWAMSEDEVALVVLEHLPEKLATPWR
jgi:hypothetical protein